ncbi:hypothetical protein NliqN6_4913 [Naganishia liquefaciens]|uniref:DH domain-containing protein n=1 Tax=Naganishia liquefaciens TaxID=104408 RepID=A0A8H3YIE6_9TREE|nr:hypothetical protein NliqN6_4913 [Naganishia liquefaciens]
MYASQSLNSAVSQESRSRKRNSMHLGKPIDLNSSTSSRDRQTGEPITKRAFHIDVVLEGTGKDNVGHATRELLGHLGKPLSYSSFISEATTGPTALKAGTSSAPGTPSKTDKAGKQDPIRLGKVVNELKETEQGYLRRISYLKTSYADPLRKFAKRKETTIIPLYEANVIFANIDNLVTSAEAFCRDLMLVDLSGRVPGHGVGEICLKHLKELGTFDCYKAYYDRQDESQRALQAMFKKQSFQTFTEGVKYQTSGIGNSGIRELLAEPVQRIPRYLLLWQAMIDSMSPYDAQRPKLEECIVLASKIAACEADERIKRATVMYCMERTVDGFPANLISNNRDYIDSIDVEDVVTDLDRRSGSAGPSGSPLRPSLSHHASSHSGPQRISVLHCTLILFDDKLVIIKRMAATVNGKNVTGLDSIDKMMKAGGGLNGVAHSGTTLLKDKLEFRGVVDILDVIATDVGNSEFELFFEKPPVDQGPRWTGRPFRHFQVVHPPMPANTEYTPTKLDKQRFVQNIWKAQALARTKLSASGQRTTGLAPAIALPVAFVSNENRKLAGSDRLAGQAISFWNVWERDSWLSHPHKSKVVLHVDETGTSALLPTSDDQNPLVVIRAAPSLDGTCSVSIRSLGSTEEDMEDDALSLKNIVDKVVETINVLGLYRFRTSNGSLPGTPTHAYRLRPSAMNLDSISKNLFGSDTVSSGQESTMGSRKSHSVVSRSSTIDTARFSMSSKSTAATSLGHELSIKTPSPGRARKSSSPQIVELHHLSGMSPRRGNGTEPLIGEGKLLSAQGEVANKSEADLEFQLDLARRNSASVASSGYAATHAVYGSIHGHTMRYQGPPSPQRGSLVVRNRTPTPPMETHEESQVRSPSSSANVIRPLDLSRRKTPSPTPNRLNTVSGTSSTISQRVKEDNPDVFSPTSPALSRMCSARTTGSATRPSGPRLAPQSSGRSAVSIGSSFTTLSVSSSHGRSISPARETIPLQEISNDNSRISPNTSQKRARSQEELAPRKRSADYTTMAPISNASTSRASSASGLQAEHDHMRGVVASPRQVSSTSVASRDTVIAQHRQDRVGHRKLLANYYAPECATENTDEHVTIAIRTSRSIRAEMMELNTRLGRDVASKERIRRIDSLNPSICRSPPSKRLSRRAAPDSGELESAVYGSVSSRHSVQSTRSELDVGIIDDWTQNVTVLLDQLDHDLEQAKMGSGRTGAALTTMKIAMEKSASQLTSVRADLDAAIARNALDKAQIADLQSELEAVYEAFNVELDGMFDDANLPPDEAFATLRRDLQTTKAQRNDMRLENIKLRKQLENSTLEKEQLQLLLKRHEGVLPAPPSV